MDVNYFAQASWFPAVIVFVAFFDLALKMYAGWYAARRGQKWWFILILIGNTIGIIPIAYLVLNPVSKSTAKHSKK